MTHSSEVRQIQDWWSQPFTAMKKPDALAFPLPPGMPASPSAPGRQPTAAWIPRPDIPVGVGLAPLQSREQDGMVHARGLSEECRER